MTKFPNPPMYPSQVQLLEQNLTIKMKNNSWISRLGWGGGGAVHEIGIYFPLCYID